MPVLGMGLYTKITRDWLEHRFQKRAVGGGRLLAPGARHAQPDAGAEARFFARLRDPVTRATLRRDGDALVGSRHHLVHDSEAHKGFWPNDQLQPRELDLYGLRFVD